MSEQIKTQDQLDIQDTPSPEAIYTNSFVSADKDLVLVEEEWKKLYLDQYAVEVDIEFVKTQSGYITIYVKPKVETDLSLQNTVPLLIREPAGDKYFYVTFDSRDEDITRVYNYATQLVLVRHFPNIRHHIGTGSKDGIQGWEIEDSNFDEVRKKLKTLLPEIAQEALREIRSEHE